LIVALSASAAVAAQHTARAQASTRLSAAVPSHPRNNAGDRRFALLPRDRSRLRAPSRRPTMNNVIYLIGLVVIVMAILSLLGLR